MAFCHELGAALSAEGNQKFLTLTPDIAKASMNEGRGKIPFTVKNISSEDVVFTENWRIVVDLMTIDEAGKMVAIEDFRDSHRTRFYSGPGPSPIVLKPGETGTYNSQFSMATMAFVLGKNKKIFGKILGRTLHTNRLFDACSDQFAIPVELARPPWDDLGEQSYFSITVDENKPDIRYSGTKKSPEGSQYWAVVMFPIKITNTTGQPLLVNAIHVSFCRVEGVRKSTPDLWELVGDMQIVARPNKDLTLLKPGESVRAGGRSYIIMWNNLPDEWKKGDTLVVGVAGRIPDTNKVFECYSEPFGFPEIP